jgi:DNA mismatch repair ATPase MutS
VLFAYVKDNLMNNLNHIKKKFSGSEVIIFLDETTVKNLELIKNLQMAQLLILYFANN